MSKLHQIFCVCCLWPRLGPPLAVLHCVIYYHFCPFPTTGPMVVIHVTNYGSSFSAMSSASKHPCCTVLVASCPRQQWMPKTRQVLCAGGTGVEYALFIPASVLCTCRILVASEKSGKFIQSSETNRDIA